MCAYFKRSEGSLAARLVRLGKISDRAEFRNNDMKNDTVSKEIQYQELIADVQKAYLSESRELRWCEECKEINLWAYWQGRGHLDADIMLVGQDWGCPKTSVETMKTYAT